MRIVHVLTTLAVGGTERQVLALAKRMAARGHTVALLVLRRREADHFPTDLNVLYLAMDKTLPGLVSGLRDGRAFLRAFRPDIVHSHNFHGNMFARLMRLLYPHAKFVSTIHNVYEGGRMRMISYRLTDRLADRTIAVSEAVSDRFVRLKAATQHKCAVITNGIETEKFAADPKRRATIRPQMRVTDEFVWLTVGRNTAAKDRPNLLQAFGRAWYADPKIQLWIVGDRTAVPYDAAGLGISMHSGALESVRRLGLRSDIPALMDGADGFVMASAWEGMPLALAEAMAMEKPVVATDVGGVRELVGDAGVLVPAKDPEALAGAMVRMMQVTASNRSAMGRAARQRILERFDLDGKIEEWEALYRSLLSAKQCPNGIDHTT